MIYELMKEEMDRGGEWEDPTDDPFPVLKRCSSPPPPNLSTLKPTPLIGRALPMIYFGCRKGAPDPLDSKPQNTRHEPQYTKHAAGSQKKKS